MANILVVDDELGIREALADILDDGGHTVILAENAQAARAARAKGAPDLVLLDIWMPDTDGVSLLKEWSAAGLLTMPVIMMSGHGTIDTAVEATRIGAIDYLEKPIALAKLNAAIKKGLTPKLTASPALRASAQATLMAATQPPPPPPPPEPEPLPEPSVKGIDFEQPLREARDAFERAYFEYHLAREKGGMTRIADKTGLERTHLYRKLKQLGLPVGRKGDAAAQAAASAALMPAGTAIGDMAEEADE
jgi:DNA-binding NtrC family response regulator